MKHFLYLLTCIAILQGCCKNKENVQSINLPINMLFSYKANDTIIFECQSKLLFDTTIIDSVIFGYDQTDQNYEQYQTVNYKIIRLGVKVDIGGFTTGLNYVTSNWQGPGTEISFDKDTLQSINIMGRDIYNVYKIQIGNDPNTNSLLTKQIYFNANSGFVKIIYANNDTFDLYKVNPYQKNRSIIQ